MTFRSEYAEILAEMEAKAAPKLTIAERVSRWFDRPAREPSNPDHFAWHSVADVLPIDGEDNV